MLDFFKFNDDVCIYPSGLDEWGLPIKGESNCVKTKGLIREILEQRTLTNQKGKNVVVDYTITLPSNTQVTHSDLIGIDVDGVNKQFEIQRMRVIKDLSGEPTSVKVWV